MNHFFTLILSFSFIHILAQEVQISGVVKDQYSQPLVFGGMIYINNIPAATTDLNGAFRINCKKGDTILIRQSENPNKVFIIAEQDSIYHVEIHTVGPDHADGYKHQNYLILSGFRRGPYFNGEILGSFEHYDKDEFGSMPRHQFTNHLDFGLSGVYESNLRNISPFIQINTEIPRTLFVFRRKNALRLMQPYSNIGIIIDLIQTKVSPRLDFGIIPFELKMNRFFSIGFDIRYSVDKFINERFSYGIRISKPFIKGTGWHMEQEIRKDKYY
jgi:hypothetical protein